MFTIADRQTAIIASIAPLFGPFVGVAVGPHPRLWVGRSAIVCFFCMQLHRSVEYT